MNDTIQLHNFIWFLVVGGFAGWIASVLVEGTGLGLFGDIGFGVLGAFMGGFLATWFNITVYGFWGVLGMSILGAVILLILFRAFTPRLRRV